MRKRIGWTRRDENRVKFKVQVWLFAGTLRWEKQTGRFERWEPYTPDAEDWDQLEEDVSRRIGRGILGEDALRLVRDSRPR